MGCHGLILHPQSPNISLVGAMVQGRDQAALDPLPGRGLALAGSVRRLREVLDTDPFSSFPPHTSCPGWSPLHPSLCHLLSWV